MELTEQQESKVKRLATELNLSPESVLALILESGIEKFALLQKPSPSDFSAKLEALHRLASASSTRFKTAQEVKDHLESLRQGS